MKGEDGKIDGASCVGEVPCKGGIYSPAGAYAAFDPRGGEKKKEGGREQSEAHVIKAGECHIRCA